MRLHRIDDPRDRLEKATRKELERFAKANGVPYSPGEPAMITRHKLRVAHLTDIPIPPRPLGAIAPSRTVTNFGQPADKTVDALSVLESDWKSQHYDEMPMHELRKLAKSKGLVINRRTNKRQLVEILNGENAS